METEYPDAHKSVTLRELERRAGEFEVPDGAIAALKAGAVPVIVFLRSTGEEYTLVSREDDNPPGAPREL